MTSGGYFLSPTIDHQHHSDRRYEQQQQQQQEKYHHLPTLSAIVPAVSRLHLPSQQRHIIIRRASLPQQQHLPPANDHPTSSPAVTFVKKIDMLQVIFSNFSQI